MKATIKVSFTITGEMIEFVLSQMIANSSKLTKSAVEIEIRDLLRTDGELNFNYREVEEESFEIARTVARDMFPDFF